MTADPLLLARLQGMWNRPTAAEVLEQPTRKGAEIEKAAPLPAAMLDATPRNAKCSSHSVSSDWLDEPSPSRPGWVRSTCRWCGAFVGNRPADILER